jgi:WD40 repeat protein/energy-coupling factor transporter ATP-binding protein EcfA2
VADDTYDVFVSYSRADGRHATEIDSVLRDKGLKTFFDRRNLAAGLPWVRALEQAIGAAKAVIVLIGPRGLGNTQQYERELAFVRQTRDPAFPIVPVILPETTADLPFDFLQILTWIDFSRVTRVSDAPETFEQLLTAVHGGKTPAEGPREAICPYRGLDAFREEDAAFFFGRGSADDPESAIGQLVSKVREHPFVMVVGRSGSGKSSLVYAGLLPALRREQDRFWNALSLRPGPTPLRALAAAFNPRADGEGAAEYANRITKEADELRTGDPELLSYMIRGQLDQTEGKPNNLLLYIDQWEELYAQAPPSSDKERAAQHTADVNRFIDLLLTASRTAPVAVVATVRADFYDPLIGHDEIKSLLPTRQVLLGKMLRSELESTIIEPARKVRLTFDPPKLVQRILDEAGEDEGMLPLLQYALKESWALRKDNTISGDSYARSGGVREAIRITAERTFEALSDEDQQAARQLFLRLVTPGEGQEDTRARAAMPSEPMQRRIVDQFAGPRTRLLVTGQDRAGRPIVEVAHEALIRTWPRLRGWIDANREKLRARAAVLQAKAEWEQHGRREDLLLPAGFQLERARAFLAERGDRAPGDITTDDIKEFISLSSARAARLQRITRWAVAAVGAVILIAGATVGYFQWDKARQLAKKEAALTESRQQLDEARANVSAGQASNVALKESLNTRQVELDEARASVSAQQASNTALKESLNTRQVELDHTQANILAELSAARLSRGDFDSALRLASRGTRIDLALPPDKTRASPAATALAVAVSRANWRLAGHSSYVSSAAFSPDGLRIVTASNDKTARIWDAASAKEFAVLRGHGNTVQSAAFSPDGSRIVTASYDKTARIWDAASAKEIAVLRGHADLLLSAAFSPDGSRIITASWDKTARIWDAASGKELAVLRGHEAGVNSAAFSPDGSRIVTALYDNTARIWDAASAKEIAVLRGNDSNVNSAAFSPDGSRIVTALYNKTARIWDAASGKGIAVLRGHESTVLSAAFNPDGSRIITASVDTTARIWDASSGKELAVLRGHVNNVRSAAFSPDGLRIVTASLDKTARIWDASSAKEIAVLRGHDEDVRSAAFSPDGSRVVTASADRTARIWDAASAKGIAVLRGHEGTVLSAAFSPDGSRIVTASADKTARIWDVHFQTMSVKDLLAEACMHLAGMTKLTREEMRLAGYPDSMSEIDICTNRQ